MILSCDPPRHAFLIHFGKRRQQQSIQILESKYGGAIVEIALNTQSVPPTLIAIHFIRHKFRLPFISLKDEFSTTAFSFKSGRRMNQYSFLFVFEPRDCYKWQVHSGLTVLVSDPPQSDSVWSTPVTDRPVLYGLLVDTDVLGVDIDMSEFIFEFGADTLKDVSVDLFIDTHGD